MERKIQNFFYKGLDLVKDATKEDRITMVPFWIMLCSSMIILIISMLSKYLVFDIIGLFLSFINIIAAFVTSYGLQTKDIRKLNEELSDIPGFKNLKMDFPKEVIVSLLISNNKLIIDNEKFFKKIYANIKDLNDEEVLFILTRIKLYKNPMLLKDIVLTIVIFVVNLFNFTYMKNAIVIVAIFIIFYSFVFLTWYFSNKKKMYICNVMEEFLTHRLAKLDDTINEIK